MKPNRKTLYERWTKDAIKCYKQDGLCPGCDLNELFKTMASNGQANKCQMKIAVKQLLENLGPPPVDDFESMPLLETPKRMEVKELLKQMEMNKHKVKQPIKPKEENLMEGNKIQLTEKSIELLNALGNKTLSRNELAESLNQTVPQVSGILLWLLKKNIVEKIDDNAYRLFNNGMEGFVAKDRTKKEKKSETLPGEQKPSNDEQTPPVYEQKPAEKIQKPIEDDQELFKHLRQMRGVLGPKPEKLPFDNQEIIRLLSRIVGLLEKLVA